MTFNRFFPKDRQRPVSSDNGAFQYDSIGKNLKRNTKYEIYVALAALKIGEVAYIPFTNEKAVRCHIWRFRKKYLRTFKVTKVNDELLVTRL